MKILHLPVFSCVDHKRSSTVSLACWFNSKRTLEVKSENQIWKNDLSFTLNVQTIRSVIGKGENSMHRSWRRNGYRQIYIITILLPEEGYKFQLLLGHPTSTVEASRSLWSQYNPNRWWCPTARRVYTVSLYNIQCILCTVHSVYSVYYTVNTSKNTQNPPRRQKLCLGHLEGTLVGLCRRT